MFIAHGRDMHLDMDDRAVFAQVSLLLGNTLLLTGQELMHLARTGIPIGRMGNLLESVVQQFEARIP